MNRIFFALLLAPFFHTIGYPQNQQNEKFIFKHNTYQLHELFSGQHLDKAKESRRKMDSVVFNGKYKANYESLSQHKTPEWFMDAKFGIAINYGIYSVAGAGEQGYGGNYYTDTYTNSMYGSLKSYHTKTWGEDFERDDFIPLYNARYLDADEYLELFKQTGAKYFTVFLNHRSTGMLLWNSEYTFRDSKDMSPNRDLAGEFKMACKKQGIRFCAYFNLEDTDYPIINPENNDLYIREWTVIDPKQPAQNGSYEILRKFDPSTEQRRLQGKIPVYDYVDDYLLPISKELIDKYEPDYIWFDGGWKRPAWYYKSHKMVAYFYNKNEGKKDVLVNCRMGADLYGKLGDVAISEGGNLDGIERTMYWEEISPMGRNFAYDKWENDDNTPSSTDLIRMLVRIVARGGNFLLIVAPDGEGKIPDCQAKRLNEIGKWLKTNGEAIFKTRPHTIFREEDKFGNTTFYTQSKDQKYSYAIATKLGDNRMILTRAKAKEGTSIRLLGYDKDLDWFNSKWGLNIMIAEKVLKDLPCSHAWTFRFEWEHSEDDYKIQTE
jgi:alpha-L-fucosidase